MCPLLIGKIKNLIYTYSKLCPKIFKFYSVKSYQILSTNIKSIQKYRSILDNYFTLNIVIN